MAYAQDTTSGRLLTVYDRGTKSAFLTDAKTLSAALKKANIELDPRDTVEPSRDEELVAPEYKVNIYRARPVVVVDGSVRTKVMTPYQTAERIASDAGSPLYAEDVTKISRSNDLTGDGAGLQLAIDRAIPITLDLYGRKNETRTQGETVADMLSEKKIELGDTGRTSVPLDTPITLGMEVRVWREGKQTTSVDEPVAFSIQQIYDADRPLGYRAIQTIGVEGVRTITYEIEIKEGQEVSRNKIAEIIAKAPVNQTLVVGIQGMGQGLTKAKGAQFFTDSKGVSHRETYYDLDMGRVMQACGQGGIYSVRVDGVKVDAAGYVIIAANYSRYPRCSLVETSVGPGRVYDTGGFAARIPDGFDIATDWSNNNGR
ncbi:MAG: ubiquitin-like domain-containing protein [Candidatus Saccharimonadaceae bacterium]